MQLKKDKGPQLRPFALVVMKWARLEFAETEAIVSKVKAAVSHHEAEVAELRADRELAVEYLKAAMESLDDPEGRAAGLLALRTVAEIDNV